MADDTRFAALRHREPHFEWEQSVDEVNIFIPLDPPPASVRLPHGAGTRIRASMLDVRIDATGLRVALKTQQTQQAQQAQQTQSASTTETTTAQSKEGDETQQQPEIGVFLQGTFPHHIKASESLWTIDDGVLNLVLIKGNRGVTWPSVFQGVASVDPLSHEKDKQQALLQRFQEEHPGFDFSGAEFNGAAPAANKFMDGFA